MSTDAEPRNYEVFRTEASVVAESDAQVSMDGQEWRSSSSPKCEALVGVENKATDTSSCEQLSKTWSSNPESDTSDLAGVAISETSVLARGVPSGAGHSRFGEDQVLSSSETEHSNMHTLPANEEWSSIHCQNDKELIENHAGDDSAKTSNKEESSLEVANDGNMEQEAASVHMMSQVHKKHKSDCVDVKRSSLDIHIKDVAADAKEVMNTTDDDDDMGGWKIEISDVRTVCLEDEDVDTDANDTTIIDLGQSDDLSQGTGSQDEFLTAFTEKSVPIRDGRTTSTPTRSGDVLSDSEENRTSPKIPTKLASKKNASSTIQSILEQEHEGSDVLQHMYMQTSTLHDPELSTMNTTNDKESLKNVSASDLLSELADSIKKIKPEPPDTGYAKALSFNPNNQDKINTERQDTTLNEMLRLPTNMKILSSGEKLKDETFPDTPVIKPLPSSRLVQIMQHSDKASETSLNTSNSGVKKCSRRGLQSDSMVTPSLKSPAHTRSEPTVNSNQSKTLACLVPVQTGEQKCMLVSVPLPGATPTTSQIPVKGSPKPKSVKKTSKKATGLDNLLNEKFNFQQHLMNEIGKYSMTSVDVDDVWKFLQRKSAVKMYKTEKAPDHLNVHSIQHACLECGDSFAMQTSLQCHMSRYSMKITFTCNVCNLTYCFSNKCQLLSHIRHDSTQPNEKCTPTIRIDSDCLSIVTPSLSSLCNNELANGKEPEQPGKIHLPTQRVKCPMCKQDFTNENFLRVHFGSSDLICSFAYQCIQCSMVMPRPCALAAHKALHKTCHNYVCPECGKPFSDAFFFSRHIRDECLHTSRVYLVECPLCHLQLEGLVVARKHMLQKHAKTFYKCPVCVVAYEKMDILQLHINESHFRKTIPCDVVSISSCPFLQCKSLFNNGTVLEKHVDLHISELKKNAKYGYKCLDCTGSTPVYSTKAQLINHSIDVHKKILKVNCNCCGLLFKTSEDADRHRQRMHVSQLHFAKSPPSLGEDPCLCTYCNMRFLSIDALKEHRCMKKRTVPIQPKSTQQPLQVAFCGRCKMYIPQDGHVCTVVNPSQKQLKSKPFPIRMVSVPSKPKVENKLEYLCMYCNKLIPETVHLEKHMAVCSTRTLVSTDSQNTFSCNLCNVRFPSENRLQVHVKEHGKTGYHVCTQCNLVAFKTLKVLQNHCISCPFPRSGISANEEKCAVCLQIVDKLALIDHLKNHTSKGILVCCHCQGDDFTDIEEWNIHEIECGRNAYPLEHAHCYTCESSFGILEKLVVHLQDHVRNGTFVCCKCQSSFSTNQELKEHHAVCGSEQIQSHSEYCSLCRRSFPNEKPGFLYRHITRHVTKGALICCVCQRMGWDSYSDVKSHQIACGTIPKQECKYTCKVCGSGFGRKDELTNHLHWHSQHEYLVCCKCQKTKWKNRRAWRRHENKCHYDPDQPTKIVKSTSRSKSTENGSGFMMMNHFCEHCGKRFQCASLLQQHVVTEHQTFPCHLCGLTYTSKVELVNHVNVNHDGKRTYISCDICKAKKIEKRFSSQLGFEFHMSRVHKRKPRTSSTDAKEIDMNRASKSTGLSDGGAESSGLSPIKKLRVAGDSDYTCAKCSFVTEDGAVFSEHIKEHNTTNANQCPDCGLCFAIIATLKKHLFLVHKIRNSEKYLQEKGLKTEDDDLDSDAEDVHPELKRARCVNNLDMMMSGVSQPKKTKQDSSEDEANDQSGNPLECTVCYRIFENEKLLKSHMRTHGMAFIKATKRSAILKNSSMARQPSDCKSETLVTSCKMEEAVAENMEAKADGSSTTVSLEMKTCKEDPQQVDETSIKTVKQEVLEDSS